MSLLDKASLVVTPNAYKASKLYSVIPSSGAGDLDVVRATTATRVNSAGLIESVAVNVPRIDYTNGSCPAILCEPQRTNYALNSNDISQWINQTTNTTLTRILTGGITTGGAFDRVVTTGTGAKGRYVQTSSLIGSNAVMSIYLRGTGQVSIGIANVGQTIATPLTLTTEWKRFETKITTGITGYMDFSIYLFGGSSVDISAVQLEFSTFSTSYIPTVASTTRNADVISKTGISSLIDSQQGVLFADLQFLTGIGGIRSINISNGSNNNRIGFYGHPSIADRITFAISSGGVTTDINYNGVILTNRNKVLIRYSGTTFTSFVNGVKSANQTFTPFAANFLNRIGLDYGEDILRYEGRINSIQLYKTALTDTECINLTTL